MVCYKNEITRKNKREDKYILKYYNIGAFLCKRFRSMSFIKYDSIWRQTGL